MRRTYEIGQRPVELGRQGNAPQVVNVEGQGSPEMPARMEGIDAIRRKNRWWFDNHEIHSVAVSGPSPHGDRFIVTMKWDATPKVGPCAGKRMQFEEAGLYTLRDGKVAQ